MTATDFNQRTIDEFHAKQGRGVGGWGDALLLMTSKGVSSGQDITTPLVHRRDGDSFIVVASKAGAPEDPNWYRSVQVNPVVDIEVAAPEGTEHLQVRARVVADGPERDRLYAYMTEVWPAFADYETKTERVIPVVILEP
ncbi:MAG: nitroreductase/quinone reductase family protein [Candidatus Dormibacteria bacterium]